MTIAIKELKVRVIGQCRRSIQNARALRSVSTAAVVVGFCCDVITWELARRGVRCSSAETSGRAEFSACERGNSILDRGQLFQYFESPAGQGAIRRISASNTAYL